MTQVLQLEGQFIVTPLTAVNYHSLSYKLPNYLGSPSYHCTALIYPKPNYSLEGDCGVICVPYLMNSYIMWSTLEQVQEKLRQNLV